ncbi:alpha-glucan family phosphorylase [Candidatus Woesearchaeota archaeon]|nr:alpha-glucan family phosphorylase [Candidatus Woesearchaeota archaeon]MCF7901128.1 alpha-glucan family phosphorylase [Candidatus Woesearchaeota archaeon]MCF8012883.1 alpha-glucan family phosphorylase [Candidatus Woesearchaeota archaeon]
MASQDNLIAYFSMEIGLSEEIPTYSGGLGILAGDTLKSFADLGMDVVGITLLSEKGYFFQKINEEGMQQEHDTNWALNDYLNKLDKEIEINIENRTVYVIAWEKIIKGINGKQIRVLFLDTNLEKNTPEDRNLTSHLYGGDLDYRLKQEIILGVGGVKMLRAFNYTPSKFHMNEGHAAFLTLELYKELLDINDPNERLKQIRKTCSFTTHTPVPAGHDSFEYETVRNFLGDLMPGYIGDMVQKEGKFSMTTLAMNFSSYINAVSKKHQEVTNNMFPENKKIDYITNGVHTDTWTSKHISKILDKYLSDWRKNPLDLRNAFRIPLTEIDEIHKEAKKDLINYVNNHGNAGFDVDIFTIGFARRATAYKRANLILKDIERLKKISKEKGKIQIIFAGKAHPRDIQGKEILQGIIRRIKELEHEIKICYLENYDMHVSKYMTSGCDLWLNTPKRPLEASGTSGMKAAHNAIPSISILDGWWIEGFIENVTGWSIGEENPKELDENKLDELDANSLYEQLENIIIPMYYKDHNKYLEIMRSTLAINGSYFNTHRMAKQYLVRAYARNQEN